MPQYGLRDDQWDRINDMLPGREGYIGVMANNNRRCSRKRCSIGTEPAPRGGQSTRLLSHPGQTHDLQGSDALLPYAGRYPVGRQSLRCRRARHNSAGSGQDGRHSSQEQPQGTAPFRQGTVQGPPSHRKLLLQCSSNSAPSLPATTRPPGTSSLQSTSPLLLD